MSKKNKYKAGKSEVLIIPTPPPNTSGRQGYFSDESPDGFYIEWNGDGDVEIVVRKDGVNYFQSINQFIKNSETKPSSHE